MRCRFGKWKTEKINRDAVKMTIGGWDTARIRDTVREWTEVAADVRQACRLAPGAEFKTRDVLKAALKRLVPELFEHVLDEHHRLRPGDEAGAPTHADVACFFQGKVRQTQAGTRPLHFLFLGFCVDAPQNTANRRGFPATSSDFNTHFFACLV